MPEAANARPRFDGCRLESIGEPRRRGRVDPIESGTALVMVTHGVDRSEVMDVLRRRWPDLVLKSLEQEEPAVAMTAEDAADLGRCRRSVEPLGIVTMPQHDRQPTASSLIEPMPVIV
jgi:hypothetical protein